MAIVRPWPVSAHYCLSDPEGATYTLRLPLHDGCTVRARRYQRITGETHTTPMPEGSSVTLPVALDSPVLATYIPSCYVHGRASQSDDVLAVQAELHELLCRAVAMPALPGELWTAYDDLAIAPSLSGFAPSDGVSFDEDLKAVVSRIRVDARTTSIGAAVRLLARQAGWPIDYRAALIARLSALVSSDPEGELAVTIQTRARRRTIRKHATTDVK